MTVRHGSSDAGIRRSGGSGCCSSRAWFGRVDGSTGDACERPSTVATACRSSGPAQWPARPGVSQTGGRETRTRLSRREPAPVRSPPAGVCSAVPAASAPSSGYRRRRISRENDRVNVDQLILMAERKRHSRCADRIDDVRREYRTGRPPRAWRGPPTGTRPAIRFHSVSLVSDG
jgi:hypothetical protein